MKITLVSTSNKIQKIQLQITNPLDPLVLYILDLSEVEFVNVKKEQSLLIDFQNFPAFLLKMLDLCTNDKMQNFVCILHKININDALLIVQERTQFRELNHLILNVHQANDSVLKKFLGSLSVKYKKLYEDTYAELEKTSENCDLLVKQNVNLKEEVQKGLLDKQTALDNVINEKNKEINQVKEKCFIEQKDKVDEMEKSKNKKISELENKILQLQEGFDNVMKEKQNLEDYKMKLEMSHKDLEGKHAISNTELTVYKEDIAGLRHENSNLNQKCFQQEKEITELRMKNDNLLKQNEEKEKGIQNLNQLVETLTKQRESNEDTLKSLKATNNKLEDKLHTSINEINKGNELIKKLESEIKSQKSKVKSQKQTLSTQDQLVNQKQILLDEQIRTVNDLKREIETRDREINGLKNQISNLSLKLNDSEKIIEDNKQMFVYLNKKMNDNMTSPFKSRMTGFGSSDPMQSSQTSYSRQTGGIMNNNFSTNYNNFGQNTNYQNPVPGYTTDHFASSDMNIQNNMQSSQGGLSNNSSGMMIMPETNFCNYKPGSKLGMTIDKYANTANTSGGNLLNHKYGMMNSTISAGNDLSSGSVGLKGDGGITYNLEEEFPRQMNPAQMMMNQK